MKWILTFLLGTLLIILLYLFGVFSAAQSSQVKANKELSNYTRQQTAEEVATVMLTVPVVPITLDKTASDKNSYDWRANFWTKQQLDAFEKSYITPDLTDQEKADAFAYRRIDDYLYAICNPYYELYQPYVNIRVLTLGREMDRSAWINLLYDSDAPTRAMAASKLAFEINYFSESDQKEIYTALKKSFHLNDNKSKYSVIYALVYMADSQYQQYEEKSRFRFEWGYGAVLSELNPNSGVAKDIIKLATDRGIDIEQAKVSAYRELAELGSEMEQSEFESVSYYDDSREYREIFTANDSRTREVDRCNSWKKRYQLEDANLD